MRTIPFSRAREHLGRAMFGRLGTVSSPAAVDVVVTDGTEVRLTIPAGTVIRLRAGDLVLDTGTNPTER